MAEMTYCHRVCRSKYPVLGLIVTEATASIEDHSFVQTEAGELLILRGYNSFLKSDYFYVAGFVRKTYTKDGVTKTNVETVPEASHEEIRRFLAKSLSGNISFWQN
ncbi:MAG: hypothetical protein HY513_04460 [Candidatus Aenigmarchaeota archaeon]|nr:hypothetical protein [Candidatus Aenigmarchaeota archaeon]